MGDGKWTSIPTARSAIETGHVGFGPGFIEKNESIDGCGLQTKLELLAADNDIGALLLAGS
jgi:hypothetical protein